jgi:hypothetical protein
MKVYILSTHEEHGAEQVQATLDPSKLDSMMKAYNADADELAKLKDVLEKNELTPDGHGLSKAWGGIQLHIVELT